MKIKLEKLGKNIFFRIDIKPDTYDIISFMAIYKNNHIGISTHSKLCIYTNDISKVRLIDFKINEDVIIPYTIDSYNSLLIICKELSKLVYNNFHDKNKNKRLYRRGFANSIDSNGRIIILSLNRN